MKKVLMASIILPTFLSCFHNKPALVPSDAEILSGYTYIPIDPLPVTSIHKKDAVCPPGIEKSEYREVLSDLMDNDVRMLIEQADHSGNVSYGISKATVSGESYKITIDYTSIDIVSKKFKIRKSMQLKTPIEKQMDGQAQKLTRAYLRELWSVPDKSLYVPGTESYEVSLDTQPDQSPLYFVRQDRETGAYVVDEMKDSHTYCIPIHVGIGLRISVNIFIVKSNANISGIGIIGAEAEANRLKGSLIIQTMGINGRSVAAALPIQSDLNRTTAQNAIVAISAIKTMLYESKGDNRVSISPRAIGFYLPFPGDRKIVNAIISSLAMSGVEWERPYPTPPKGSAP